MAEDSRLQRTGHTALRGPRIVGARTTGALRAGEWWEYKLAPVFGTAYATGFILDHPLHSLWPALFLLLAALAVPAAFVSILNDVTDRAVDSACGKRNRTLAWGPARTTLALAAPIALGLGIAIAARGIPWFVPLYCIGWAAFSLYSVPPVRLKTRGLAGVLADSTGAHVVPQLLAIVIVSWWSNAPIAALWAGLVGLWALLCGVRGILWHQASDYECDARAGVSTFALRVGPRFLRLAGERAVFPCELAALCALLWTAGSTVAWVLLVVYAGIELLRRAVLGWAMVVFWPRRGAPLALHEFYEVFYPAAFLGAGAAAGWEGAVLLAAHFVLFPRRATRILGDLRNVGHVLSWRHVRAPLRRAGRRRQRRTLRAATKGPRLAARGSVSVSQSLTPNDTAPTLYSPHSMVVAPPSDRPLSTHIQTAHSIGGSAMPTDHKRRFTMISSCPEAWGGSEELWAGAAAALARAGHSVNAFKTVVDPAHPRIGELKALGCAVQDIKSFRIPYPQRIRNRLVPSSSRRGYWELSRPLFEQRLMSIAPDLAVVSQGENFDGLRFASLCRDIGLPYVIVCQKATSSHWPSDGVRSRMREAFQDARRCFFVSRHNLTVTEHQLGTRLPHATVVRNPFLVPYDGPLSWPDEDGTLRIACVARLWVRDKGQDLLLRVLARERWRARDLRVAFFGSGANQEGLCDLAAALGLESVEFAGHTDSVTCIWATHHALVLPSRSEGLPLALVEAMLCGRPAIVTNVGGNAEAVEDGVTGFVADTASEDAIDEAMERAWARRAEWREIGRVAAARARELVPPDPAGDFAAQLLELARRNGHAP